MRGGDVSRRGRRRGGCRSCRLGRGLQRHRDAVRTCTRIRAAQQPRKRSPGKMPRSARAAWSYVRSAAPARAESRFLVSLRLEPLSISTQAVVEPQHKVSAARGVVLRGLLAGGGARAGEAGGNRSELQRGSPGANSSAARRRGRLKRAVLFQKHCIAGRFIRGAGQRPEDGDWKPTSQRDPRWARRGV